ncbi:MAG: hypothetical protein PHX79_06730, partial [Sphaerochaetaceae bacterium]|nr:hypothetical protein [Sphaerochaetaceae bacterium]
RFWLVAKHLFVACSTKIHYSKLSVKGDTLIFAIQYLFEIPKLTVVNRPFKQAELDTTCFL